MTTVVLSSNLLRFLRWRDEMDGGPHQLEYVMITRVQQSPRWKNKPLVYIPDIYPEDFVEGLYYHQNPAPVVREDAIQYWQGVKDAWDVWKLENGGEVALTSKDKRPML